jgi:hypothetical protein
MRFLLAAALALASAAPASADEVSGTIVAYDRLDNVIVLDDKSVWALSTKALVPADLKASDRVTLTFTSSGENGANAATKLERTNE